MSLSPQDALITLMLVAAASDEARSHGELALIEDLVRRTPVFDGYDLARLPAAANACVDLINTKGLDHTVEQAISALPPRLQDTAYALAVEVTAADLTLEQEELRFLELIRDHLSLDRLTTAAIEASARARFRRA